MLGPPPEGDDTFTFIAICMKYNFFLFILHFAIDTV